MDWVNTAVSPSATPPCLLALFLSSAVCMSALRPQMGHLEPMSTLLEARVRKRKMEKRWGETLKLKKEGKYPAPIRRELKSVS